MTDTIREPQSGIEEQLARLAGEEVTPREPQSAVEQWLEKIYEDGGIGGEDGITPITTITTISGGHNVAFSYGESDPRNTDFDIMDGVDGTNGTNGTDGQDGYTPVRGTDYWTANDVSTMETYCAGYIDTALGTVINASY